MRIAPSDHATRRTAPRAGFSIVEVLVALVLLTVGLLAMAGGSALAVRTSAAAARERRAAQRAADRIARLVAQGCAPARSGTYVDSAAALSEWWTVTTLVNGALLIDAHVRWTTSSGTRSMLLRSAMLC
jgi:prepilin-type N-terminal cleavage/methylation domain-containing protein